MASDFTFDPAQDPPLAALAALYDRVMTGTALMPTVSLGAVTAPVARAWLDRQQDRYHKAIDLRSGLIKSMVLAERVTMNDLVGEP